MAECLIATIKERNSLKTMKNNKEDREDRKVNKNSKTKVRMDISTSVKCSTLTC